MTPSQTQFSDQEGSKPAGVEAVGQMRQTVRFHAGKYQRTFLSFALLAGLLVSRPSRAGPSASTSASPGKQKIHWLTPARTMETGDDLQRVEGLSLRAWTTTAGWHPGASIFPDAETGGSRMCLFWVGHKPWPHMTSPFDD
jgi:hypothetical protein